MRKIQKTSKVEAVIASLILKTKENKLYWDYIFTNSDIANISSEICDLRIDEIDEGLSFYTKYRDGYFVLINCSPEIFLIAFPTEDAYRYVNEPLNPDLDYQSDLLRLTNLAVKQHPNVEDFIDAFLLDSENDSEN